MYSAGKGSTYNYDMKQEIDEPAVERCAQMCLNANIRSKYAVKINQSASHNLSFADCQLYSYSLANQTCFIKFKAVREDFKNLQSYYSFDSLVVSGNPTCQSKFSGSQPIILMNKIRTDARQICSFASKSISFSEKQFRCVGLYNIVKYPILKHFCCHLK